ncbi:MAG: bifunctional folylpolyglutamate synthase/dihydrofolate synthase [Desulfobacterales bacterium]|uniref:Dihydrofolate synthase/folylpolyglutamate synthase n=1 Tax=Candidatus Desulfaltia bathyphila TaxID=2841697 RepID=A0A8J6N6C7_9BACT|nr:bifunctional folylpolyglutamate synthase/dihydrofolate synthase [Candidatus Desulfaltia bathyphila]MBL7195136.1 bifunctional folylpolyglutamate synthase/dihydrofolate synthase [Desulfobacterales bacterium]MBL7208250.1 bifunctional folylpolyglutamate synthase/dihydrofolate synthase [Desulfobacterales bacterium]
MYSLRRFGIKFGLFNIASILKRLNNPQNGFSCIHIAGTNGKGSIASALSSILQLSGYKVGLYTSPHLVKFNERIRINNLPVSDKKVVESYKAVNKVIQNDLEATFFELTTAMALYEFNRQKVDWAVIEAGMGGRLDATNIIKPVISIISNISVEHKKYLGSTVAQIAGEKGGIIKKSVPVITGVKQNKAILVLKKMAAKQSAPFYRFGDAFRVRRSKNGTFTYFGIDTVWRNMHTGLLGNHQVDNAAIVLAACEILNQNKTNLSFQNIKQGLAQNRWPGRLEIVSSSPLILLDGAHNLIATRCLAKFLSENPAKRKITLVTGILNDKPYAAMLACLLPLCSKAILTRPKIDRALSPERLFPAAKKIIQDIEIIPDVGKAIKYAIKTTSVNDAICIAGSLYLVGEAKEALDLSALIK